MSARNELKRDQIISCAAAAPLPERLASVRRSMWLRWLVLSASLAGVFESSWAQNVTYRYKVKGAFRALSVLSNAIVP